MIIIFSNARFSILVIKKKKEKKKPFKNIFFFFFFAELQRLIGLILGLFLSEFRISFGIFYVFKCFFTA